MTTAMTTPAPRDLTASELVSLLRRHRFGVLATVGPDGAPQAATVGYVVTDGLELVFDTLQSTRKYQNLLRDPRVAWVVTEGAETLQCQGVADLPDAAERAGLVPLYLATFPDGVARQALDDLVYVRVRVRWARYSDYTSPTPRIVELTLDA